MGWFGGSKEKSPQPPEPARVGIRLKLAELPGAIRFAGNFPRVDWGVVSQKIQSYASHPSIQLILDGHSGAMASMVANGRIG